MKCIKLSGLRGQGKYAIVDDEDYEKLSQFRWHMDSKGYPRRHLPDTGGHGAGFMHTLVLPPKDSHMVIYKSGNKLDCRKSNLMYATPQLKAWNSKLPRNNKSGYKGVHKQDNKWVAMIYAAKKQHYLGLHDTALQAAIVCENAKAAFDKGYIKTI